MKLNLVCLAVVCSFALTEVAFAKKPANKSELKRTNSVPNLTSPTLFNELHGIPPDRGPQRFFWPLESPLRSPYVPKKPDAALSSTGPFSGPFFGGSGLGAGAFAGAFADPVGYEDPDEYRYEGDDSPAPDYGKAVGFHWYTNTCFANSALKLLANHPAIFRLTAPAEVTHELTPLERAEEDVKQALHQLYRGVQRAKFSELSAIAETAVTAESALAERHSSRFQEELTHFFNQLDKYLLAKNENGKAYLYKNWMTEVEYFVRADQIDSQEFLDVLLSILKYNQDLDSPRLESLMELASGKKWITKANDKFSMLTLDLERDEMPIRSISEAVRTNFIPETLTGINQVLNPDTDLKEDGTRKWALIADAAHLPSYVFIHLKRYKNVSEHNYFGGLSHYTLPIKHHVKISAEIQLDFWPPEVSGDEIGTLAPIQVKMRPMGVVVHHGYSLNSGHYYVYLYDAELQSWFVHNDSSVKILKGRDLKEAFDDMAENGYLLLYGKDS